MPTSSLNHFTCPTQTFFSFCWLLKQMLILVTNLSISYLRVLWLQSERILKISILYKAGPEKTTLSGYLMNLRDVVLEESVTWLNSSKIKSSQIESPIALRKTQSRTSEKADIFMKVIKIDLANARTPFESVNWLCSLY